MTPNYKTVVVSRDKAAAIKRRHPWIFSGAIADKSSMPEVGEIIRVCDTSGNFLAMGHWNEESIAVKVLSFEERNVDEEFWKEKIQNATNLRTLIGLWDNPQTNVFRLINAEGDELPGLIADLYADTLVLQGHSPGMHQTLPLLARIFMELYPGKIHHVYDKSDQSLGRKYGISVRNGFLGPSGQTVLTVKENGHQFEIDLQTGQKTGFFIDQRDNRQLLSHYAKDKHLLNAFCYSGGFSVYGLAAGAASMDSLDISQKAMGLTQRNLDLNPGFNGQHREITGNIFDFFQTEKKEYDLIILDPPAFAKNRSKRHSAIIAYKGLNVEGMKKVRPGGLLFTFSCTQVVDPPLFEKTIHSAAIELKRSCRILHRLGQSADHPVNIFNPEGHYLKGMVLALD